MSTAEQLKDQGIASVISNNENWLERALDAIADNVYAGYEGIGEDFRHCVEYYVGKPTRPHAWGALIRCAILKGILAPTGEMRSMQDKRSHARQSFVYRKVGG